MTKNEVLVKVCSTIVKIDHETLRDLAKDIFAPNAAANAGNIETKPKKIEPGKVILVVTESIKSEVGLPGFIPGIKAFCPFRYSEY